MVFPFLLSLFLLASSAIAAPTHGAPQAGEDADEPHPVIFGPAPPVPPAVVARDDTGRVTFRATRIAEPIVLDGKLDDEIYRRVPGTEGFIQQEPHEGEPATERTELWIFYDDKNVYFSARCWDSHPERMVINEMRRDNFNIFQNENVTVVIDPFYDRRNGYFFQTNPLGAIRDQQVTDEGQSNNQDWNTVWDAKGSVFDQGWIAEIAIPFKSLRYKKGREQIWGFNFKRSVRWKNEEDYLSPIAASHRFRGIYRFSDAATLVGIEAPSGSRNLELKPYGITTVVTNRDPDFPLRENDAAAEGGLDVKYGLTQGLIADFTYNTDFAQVEEDQQQVNLTRFSLFFPEKREFFLEGQGIFGFGGVQQRGGSNRPGDSAADLTPILFFSRTIGLTEDGEDPILAGGRVTGRAGPFRIGGLNIQTRGIEGTAVEPTNFSVVRIRRDVLRRSDVGVIATHRTTSLTEGASANSVFGVDGNFAFFNNLRLNGYYATSRTPVDGGATLSGNDTSYLGKLDYGGDRYGLQLEHLKVGESFKPELGFVTREAFQRSFAQARFSPRPLTIQAIRRFVFQGEADYIEGEPSGRLETRRFQGRFQVEFESGDEATVEATRQHEFLPEEFEIIAGTFLPVGSYDFGDVNVIYHFGPQRPVPGFVTYRTGSFFDGRRRELTFNGRIEVSSEFSIEPNIAFNIVDIPEGPFTAKLVSSRFNWTLSPRMLLASLLQYNSTSDSLSTSVRFRWEYEPGSDFFVVFTDGRFTDVTGFPSLLSRTFAVKFTKLFRF
jgi:Domain of unknown function (DUF5916)